MIMIIKINSKNNRMWRRCILMLTNSNIAIKRVIIIEDNIRVD